MFHHLLFLYYWGRLIVHDIENRATVRARLFAHLVYRAKAICNQQAGLYTFAFKQRIRSDCSAMAEIGDLVRVYAARQQIFNTLQNGARRIVRRRGYFSNGNLTSIFIQVHEVGKRSSSIDRETVATHIILQLVLIVVLMTCAEFARK